MIIFGIDPGVSGAISILKNKEVLDVFEMPTMIDGKKNKKQVNGSALTNIITNTIDFKKLTKGTNEFSYDLPNSKRTITFKLLNGKDEKEIDSEIKAMEKISKLQSSGLTTRFKKMILSVDGNFELSFRQHLGKITPDMDMTTIVQDSSGKETEVVIPITVRFFWPNT